MESSNEEKDQSHLYNFTGDKAGMSGFDRSKVNQIINDMSKGSAFHQHATSMDAKSDERIQQLKLRLSKLDSAERKRNENRALVIEAEVEKIRYCLRPCVVVDMDCFYAAVEMRDNPDLVDKPMVVGGMSMISTANYVARSFGVRSAMPGFIAIELCPQLIFVDHRPEAYSEASRIVLSVLQEYDKDCKMMSLDEAKIDLTKYMSDHFQELDGGGWAMEDVSEVVKQMRSRVQAATNLTCSAGIGPSFMIAKVASDMNKPDGQFSVGFNKEEAISFMRKLPIRKVGGIGKVTERMVREVIGAETVQDLYDHRIEILHVFTPNLGEFLLRASLACLSDEQEGASKWSEKEPEIKRKGIGTERTFRHSLKTLSEQRAKLSDLCISLARQLEEEGLSGKNITVKLKSSGYEVKTRSFTAPRYLSTAQDLEEFGMPLLEKAFHEDVSTRSVRLMGVRVTHFKGSENLIQGQTTLSFKPKSRQSQQSQQLEEGCDGVDGRETRHEFTFGDIDESVLAELPDDIREEIKRELTASSSSSSSSYSTSASAVSSIRPSMSSSRSPVYNPIKKALENTKKRKENNTGIAAGEISEEVLNELPPEVQQDIRRQMEMEAKVRKNSVANNNNGSSSSINRGGGSMNVKGKSKPGSLFNFLQPKKKKTST